MTAEWPRTVCDEALAQPAPGPVRLATSGERRTGATRSALRRRDLRLLLLSAATSKVGDFLYVVALTAYVFERTSSAAWVSAAVLSRFVPYCVLPALAGVVADRYERRLVMVAGDLLQLIFITALTVTAALDGPTPLVLAWSVLSASSASLYLSSSSAMVAAVVPEDELAAANSMTSSIGELAFVVGPAAGGVLLLVTTPVVAFGVNAATFAVSSVLVFAITRPIARPGQPRPRRPAGAHGGVPRLPRRTHRRRAGRLPGRRHDGLRGRSRRAGPGQRPAARDRHRRPGLAAGRLRCRRRGRGAAERTHRRARPRAPCAGRCSSC